MLLNRCFYCGWEGARRKLETCEGGREAGR